MNSYHEQTNRKISDMFSSLCQYQLQKEYDTMLTLYDGECEGTPICSHHSKGCARFPLWKLLAFVGVCAVFWTLLRGLFSLFSLFSD
ncbi:MAG: hypothetical protein J6Q82_08615 [Clostridia bacterium]|nr:hypothetical protein [Clostridia bacterium]